jgi:hypothetical protein
MYDNLSRIDKITRGLWIRWPEFSWDSQPKTDQPKRGFTMLAPNISRIGYDNYGRVYSIICPQLAKASKLFGAIDVEVTVTKCRGWVNEDAGETDYMVAGMEVVGTLWLSPGTMSTPIFKALKAFIDFAGLPLPLSKDTAVRVSTSAVQDPQSPVFQILPGLSPRYENPAFASHPAAWHSAYIDVRIGTVAQTGNAIVDEFNALLVNLINAATGNMLMEGNVLSWNLFFQPPGW